VSEETKASIVGDHKCLKRECSSSWRLPNIPGSLARKKTFSLPLVLIEATQEILFAKLYPSDGVFNNMEAIRNIIEKKGLFYALYVDKASTV
jgi:hypothetical protein